MRLGFQKELNSSRFVQMTGRIAAVVLLSITAMSFAGCGNNEEAGTSFSAARSREEETGSAGKTAVENGSAAVSVAESDTLEELPEEPFIFYPYGSEVPSGVDNKIEGKPYFIDELGEYSSDKLSSIFDKCTADTDWFLNTIFNFDENTEDYTEALKEKCLSSYARINTNEENIYTVLKGIHTVSRVDSIRHCVSDIGLSRDEIAVFSDSGYISVRMSCDRCDEGDYIIPFTLRYAVDKNSGEWRMGALEVDDVLSNDQFLWPYYTGKALSLHTTHDNYPLSYDFYDPIGFLTDYKYGEMAGDDIELEEGEYYTIDEDGTVHIYDSEGNEKER